MPLTRLYSGSEWMERRFSMAHHDNAALLLPSLGSDHCYRIRQYLSRVLALVAVAVLLILNDVFAAHKLVHLSDFVISTSVVLPCLLVFVSYV